MEHISTINQVGYYCGRFSDGFFGEPQNSFTNLVFVIGAAYAFHVWRKRGGRDRWQLLLFVLAASVGVGSFVFHSVPNPTTLMIDLVPIQIFGLAYFGYVGLRHVGASKSAVLGAVLAFFLARQGWLVVAPRGAWGGGISHLPTLMLLVACGGYLHAKGDRLGRFMLLAGATYVLALVVRSWDLAVCAAVPAGLHWAWHVLTGLTASVLVIGIARAPARAPLAPAMYAGALKS